VSASGRQRLRGVTYTTMVATDGTRCTWAVYRVPTRFAAQPQRIRRLNLHRAQRIATVTTAAFGNVELSIAHCRRTSEEHAAPEWPAFEWQPAQAPAGVW
jgi:hypothetical protein